VWRERIHVEIFNGSEAMTPGVVSAATRTPHLPKDNANTGPLVAFALSGIGAYWKASACQSMLELAEACDVPVRWSCRTGVFVAIVRAVLFRGVRLRTRATRKARRRQSSRLLLTTDSRRCYRLVKTDEDSSSEVDSIFDTTSRARSLEDRRDRLPGTAGRKWMIRAQMRPKPIRGATIATSIAVVKLARTMSDRLLARRRVRADTCVALANTWPEDVVSNIGTHEQPSVKHDSGRGKLGPCNPSGRIGQERHHEEKGGS